MKLFLHTFLLGISIIWLGSSSIIAQDSLMIDTNSILEVRIPDISVIEEYSNDSDFQYGTLPEDTGGSFFEYLVYQFVRLIGYIFGNPFGEFIFKTMVIVIIAGLILLLINQFLGGNLINVFSGKKSNNPFRIAVSEDEIETTDLQKGLEDALSNSNYAAATRFVYLISLKTLNEQELITYGIEKTNYDYVTELSDHEASPLFISLTTYYEFTEYGDFEIDARGFEVVQKLFQDLKGKLKS